MTIKDIYFACADINHHDSFIVYNIDKDEFHSFDDWYKIPECVRNGKVNTFSKRANKWHFSAKF